MLLRFAQIAVALTLLGFFAGAPAAAHAHGLSNHAHSRTASEQAVAVKIQSLSAPSDHSEQHAHHPGCANCCACSGGACQGAAMLPPVVTDLVPPIVRTFTSYDALSPPRRARASLEHPPKSLA